MRQLQKTAEQIYTREYSKLTPKQQEKARDNLPNGYCYSLAKRFNLTRVKPTVVGKDRSESATTQTIIDFLNITFTRRIVKSACGQLSPTATLILLYDVYRTNCPRRSRRSHF